MAVPGRGRRIAACLGISTLVLVACAPTPLGVAPTVPPAPTSIPTTAPTVVAPTPIPIATAATPAAVLPGTAAPNYPVQIVSVLPNTVNVADVATTLRNTSTDPVDLGNWMLLFGSYLVTVPSTQYVTIAPGSDKTVHLASSVAQPNGTDIYLGYDTLLISPMIIPNQVLVLLNPQHQLISTASVPPTS